MNSILDIRKITDLEIRKAGISYIVLECYPRISKLNYLLAYKSFDIFKSNKHTNSIDFIRDVNINLSDA